MNIQVRTRFEIGQRVFHKTPESDPGIILEIRVYQDGDIEYMVTFGPGSAFWLFEEELSEDKCVI